MSIEYAIFLWMFLKARSQLKINKQTNKMFFNPIKIYFK